MLYWCKWYVLKFQLYLKYFDIFLFMFQGERYNFLKIKLFKFIDNNVGKNIIYWR